MEKKKANGQQTGPPKPICAAPPGRVHDGASKDGGKIFFYAKRCRTCRSNCTGASHAPLGALYAPVFFFYSQILNCV